MRTTSGSTATQTSSALRPSATARRPDVGHGAEQQLERLAEDVVVLDEHDGRSDRAPRSGTVSALLGAEEERIVRLAAVVDLDLELGVRLRTTATRPSTPSAPSPTRIVSTSAPLLEQPLQHLAGDRLRARGPAATGSPSSRPRNWPSSTARPPTLGVARGARDRPGAHARGRRVHRGGVLRRPARLGSKATSAPSPACTDSRRHEPGRLRGARRRPARRRG